MLMKIGEAAMRLQLTQRTLRYWESHGLISSIRGDNGYRYYDEINLSTIKDIQVMQYLGLSLDRIDEILKRQDALLLAHCLRKLAVSNQTKGEALTHLSQQLLSLSHRIESLIL